MLKLTTWKYRDDFFHLVFETNLQYPVGLINNECFQVPEHKSWSFLKTVVALPRTDYAIHMAYLQMVHQTTWCCN